jgi:hypothetical protein
MHSKNTFSYVGALHLFPMMEKLSERYSHMDAVKIEEQGMSSLANCCGQSSAFDLIDEAMNDGGRFVGSCLNNRIDK